MATQALMVQPGAVLAEKYEVERVLGEGGMGYVVAAMHLQLGQRVAIKFLKSEALENPDAVGRFLREARASARLRSEHVGRVLDVGQLADGQPFMVMEMLDGCDLSQLLQQHGPLRLPLVVDYVLQACEALAEAHARGIVHRDIKPANLFLCQSAAGTPLIKVLDFGIASAEFGEEAGSLTRTSTVMGSPVYMSPEALRAARDCDARSDIWSLGVILYELALGRQPFAAGTITEVALRIAMDPMPPMQVPGYEAFEAVVSRCLSKDPAGRHQNLAELAADLVPFGGPLAAARCATIGQVLGHRATTESGPRAHSAAPSLTSVPHRRARGWLFAALLALFAGGAATIVVMASGGSKHEATPAAAPGPAPAAEQPSDAVVAPTPAAVIEPTPGPADAGVAPATVTKPATRPKRPRPTRPAKPAPESDDEDLSRSRY
jgi:serine/threonine-protein kinase